jgi:hypothetical protein
METFSPWLGQLAGICFMMPISTEPSVMMPALQQSSLLKQKAAVFLRPPTTVAFAVMGRFTPTTGIGKPVLVITFSRF